MHRLLGLALIGLVALGGCGRRTGTGERRSAEAPSAPPAVAEARPHDFPPDVQPPGARRTPALELEPEVREGTDGRGCAYPSALWDLSTVDPLPEALLRVVGTAAGRPESVRVIVSFDGRDETCHGAYLEVRFPTLRRAEPRFVIAQVSRSGQLTFRPMPAALAAAAKRRGSFVPDVDGDSLPERLITEQEGTTLCQLEDPTGCFGCWVPPTTHYRLVGSRGRDLLETPRIHGRFPDAALEARLAGILREGSHDDACSVERLSFAMTQVLAGPLVERETHGIAISFVLGDSECHGAIDTSDYDWEPPCVPRGEPYLLRARAGSHGRVELVRGSVPSVRLVPACEGCEISAVEPGVHLGGWIGRRFVPSAAYDPGVGRSDAPERFGSHQVVRLGRYVVRVRRPGSEALVGAELIAIDGNGPEEMRFPRP